MDFINEQVVRRTVNATVALKKILILSAGVLIPLTLAICATVFKMAYFYIVAFFMLLFCIYGVWYFWTSLKVDFEYSVSDSKLTISKVIANRKRKTMLILEMNNIENLTLLKNSGLENKSYAKTFDASENPKNDNTYAAVFSSSNLGGSCLLLFSPNEKILKAMSRGLKYEIRKNFN